MQIEIITEVSTIQASNGWVDAGPHYTASFHGNNPKGVKGCPMGRSQESMASAIRDLVVRTNGESQTKFGVSDLVVVRHTDYRRILELMKTASGQYRYRILSCGTCPVGWQWGSYQRAETIEQARGRFSFDAIETVSGLGGGE